jgi:hypothetical protein
MLERVSFEHIQAERGLNFHPQLHTLMTQVEGGKPLVYIASNATGLFEGKFDLDELLGIIGTGAVNNGVFGENNTEILLQPWFNDKYATFSSLRFQNLSIHDLMASVIQLLVADAAKLEPVKDEASDFWGKEAALPFVCKQLLKKYKSKAGTFTLLSRSLKRKFLTEEERHDLAESDKHRFRYFIEEQLSDMTSEEFIDLLFEIMADRLGLHELRQRGSEQDSSTFQYTVRSQSPAKEILTLTEHKNGILAVSTEFKQHDVINVRISSDGDHTIQGYKPKLASPVRIIASTHTDLGEALRKIPGFINEGVPTNYHFNGTELNLSTQEGFHVNYLVQFPLFAQVREDNERTGHKIILQNPHSGNLTIQNITDPDVSVILGDVSGSLTIFNVSSSIDQGTIDGKYTRK